MTLRPISTALLVLIVFAAANSANADHNAWLKLFTGKWAVEGRVYTEADGWSKWSGARETELMAGDNAVLEKRTGTNGDKIVVLIGWEPAKKTLIETAYSSSGVAWTITYDSISRDSMSGAIVAGRPDGVRSTGRVTIRRDGDNSFTNEWEVKTSEGEVTKGDAVISRKSD